MKYKPRKKAQKDLLSSDEKRSVFVGAKVSPVQKEHIRMLADKCCMTMSDYILARSYNYEPKARLTDKQEEELRELGHFRMDIVNYTSQLAGMNRDERRNLFVNYSFMLGLVELLANTADRISDFLDKVGIPNTVPKGTTNKIKTLLDNDWKS